MHFQFHDTSEFASPLWGLSVDPIRLIRTAYVCRFLEAFLGSASDLKKRIEGL